MLPAEKSFLKILFASLPVLVFTGQMTDALRVGAFVCVTYWVTAGFFKLTWSFFPRGMLGFSLSALLVFLGAVFWAMTDMAPYWLASVALLGPLEFSEKRKIKKSPKNQKASKIVSNRASKIVGKGTAFFLLMIFLGAVREFLGGQWAGDFFKGPAGGLFFLGVLAVVCSYRPFSNSKPVSAEEE